MAAAPKKADQVFPTMFNATWCVFLVDSKIEATHCEVCPADELWRPGDLQRVEVLGSPWQWGCDDRVTVHRTCITFEIGTAQL